MKVYITKYALTSGITEIDGYVSNEFPDMMCPIQKGYSQPTHKPFWHETKEEAIKQANKMRDDEIKSLKRRIERLKKINFK